MSHSIKNALSVLTRISRDYPDSEKSLRTLILKDLSSYAFLSIEVAQEHDGGEPIGRILAGCLEEYGDTELFLNLYEELPAYTVALRDVHLVLTKKMAEVAQSDISGSWDLIAETTGAYATALTDNGNYEEALAFALKSACLYQRNHSEIKDIKYRSHANLAECLMNLGEIDNAILVQAESVIGYKELAHLNPDRYIAHYANSLLVLSTHQMLKENFNEAIDLCSLAKDQITQIKIISVENSFILHRINSNLAVCYEHIHELDLAAQLLYGTIDIIRDLANHSSDRYLPELIEALKVQASIESSLGNKGQALLATNEAINQMQGLYKLRPQAFASDYAGLLSNLSLVDLTFNNQKEAILKIQRAIDILMPLYEQFPKRFSPNLAALYNNSVELHLAQCNYQKALTDAHQSLCIYRQLKQKHNIAMSLNTLANVRMQLGDFPRAYRSIQTSIRIYRDLSIVDKLMLLDLAIVLGTSATIFDHVEEYQLAISDANEALNLWSVELLDIKNSHLQQYLQVARVRLSCLYSLEEYEEGIEWAEHLLSIVNSHEQLDVRLQAGILNLYSLILAEQGNYEKAVLISMQEVTCLESLPTDEFLSYKVELADALVNLCVMQVQADDDGAYNSIQKAVNNYKSIPLPLVPAVLNNKATALFNQASMAHVNGMDDFAIQSLEEALIDQRHLIEIDKKIAIYPTDLLSSLQLLTNILYKKNDLRFEVVADELNFWLEQIPSDAEVIELQQQLKVLQKNFWSR